MDPCDAVLSMTTEISWYQNVAQGKTTESCGSLKNTNNEGFVTCNICLSSTNGIKSPSSHRAWHSTITNFMRENCDWPFAIQRWYCDLCPKRCTLWYLSSVVLIVDIKLDINQKHSKGYSEQQQLCNFYHYFLSHVINLINKRYNETTEQQLQRKSWLQKAVWYKRK